MWMTRPPSSRWHLGFLVGEDGLRKTRWWEAGDGFCLFGGAHQSSARFWSLRTVSSLLVHPTLLVMWRHEGLQPRVALQCVMEVQADALQKRTRYPLHFFNEEKCAPTLSRYVVTTTECDGDCCLYVWTTHTHSRLHALRFVGEELRNQGGCGCASALVREASNPTSSLLHPSRKERR